MDTHVQARMLEELRKTRDAVEPKPVPPVETPKGFWAEFRMFLEKQKVCLALAEI